MSLFSRKLVVIPADKVVKFVEAGKPFVSDVPGYFVPSARMLEILHALIDRQYEMEGEQQAPEVPAATQINVFLDVNISKKKIQNIVVKAPPAGSSPESMESQS